MIKCTATNQRSAFSEWLTVFRQRILQYQKPLFTSFIVSVLCSACSTHTIRQSANDTVDPYLGAPPKMEEQVRQAICFIKKFAPKDYPAEVDFDCRERVLMLDAAISAQLDQQRNQPDYAGCFVNIDSTKVKVVVAEVLLSNRENPAYQPGSAIFISAYSVCHQLTKS